MEALTSHLIFALHLWTEYDYFVSIYEHDVMFLGFFTYGVVSLPKGRKFDERTRARRTWGSMLRGERYKGNLLITRVSFPLNRSSHFSSLRKALYELDRQHGPVHRCFGNNEA